ncbi:hypothetical protein Pmar_PMAR003562 [Perkinsus marinus ATCC 50983]|uniref:Uncharacterized protein n=1 Tax=Perkinsus marinus (strain ATCC 50983 / TXsc) TaxID=423536 RepID=C5KHN7_PERM5|nr:hypothetical protein Pmar_PMAR003562 [Perkinsus marinus ATCC 50983]EER16099.1 hypothetical protein Pmar_PMAR003562 [Perkinsus marinus ATCC 50983]|eukprot:XP_002784303.1 hypothetical protein Pmar_PMAR003562 [Perkinsus marinus ATCC 50983]
MSFDEGDWSPMKHVDGDRLEGFRESLPQRAERSEELKHQMEKVKEYMDKLSKAQSEVARLFEEQLVDEAGDRESDHFREACKLFMTQAEAWRNAVESAQPKIDRALSRADMVAAHYRHLEGADDLSDIDRATAMKVYQSVECPGADYAKLLVPYSRFLGFCAPAKHTAEILVKDVPSEVRRGMKDVPQPVVLAERSTDHDSDSSSSSSSNNVITVVKALTLRVITSMKSTTTMMTMSIMDE